MSTKTRLGAWLDRVEQSRNLILRNNHGWEDNNSASLECAVAALRAFDEMHKETILELSSGENIPTGHCDCNDNYEGYSTPYPCPTRVAIEKGCGL